MTGATQAGGAPWTGCGAWDGEPAGTARRRAAAGSAAGEHGAAAPTQPDAPLRAEGPGNGVGEFVVSLDFELLWGVRDHKDRDRYGQAILGGRAAIPRILDLFERHGVAATWATVGFVFCDTRDELMAVLPSEELRPRYDDPGLSSYTYLHEVGRDEAADPHYLGGSLVRRIQATPRQEIGTHTLSHFYCLEDGSTPAAFAADLDAACRLARGKGVEVRSIVFPRNQFAPAHLGICQARGLTAYRGTPSSWAYRSAKGADQTLARRSLRLIDAHTGVLDPLTYRLDRDRGSFRDIPASRFLRPPRRGRTYAVHLGVVKRSMTEAARRGRGFHLWWHPHNFGPDPEPGLAALSGLLEHFARLADSHGMVSRTMAGGVTMRIVILGGPGESTWVLANRLLRAGHADIEVILEDRSPRVALLRGRARRLGGAAALGQALFILLGQPFLRRAALPRICEIMQEWDLDPRPPAGLPIHRVPSVNAPEAVAQLAASRPELVLVNGTRILRRACLRAVEAPFVNVHAGITPDFRGVHGGYWALRSGRPEDFGATIHLVDEGVDTGAVLRQVRGRPAPRDSFATYPLLQQGLALGPLMELVAEAAAGRGLPTPQPAGTPGRQWYHPTLWQYLAGRIRGIR